MNACSMKLPVLLFNKFKSFNLVSFLEFSNTLLTSSQINDYLERLENFQNDGEDIQR